MEEVGSDVADNGMGGADANMSGTFFKAVIQAILLFGLETWVVTPFISQTLGVFHNMVYFRMTGKQPWRCNYGSLVYPTR